MAMVILPVLIVGFNRPDLLSKVLRATKSSGCLNIYFATDGPRNLDDKNKIKECIDILLSFFPAIQPKQILRHEVNLGCRIAMATNIRWFFKQVELGIVLEDDCLPDQSFFGYATTLLERFRQDSRIGQVCGYNLLPEQSPAESDYFPSHFGWSWGWASWRRSWQNFDLAMTSWPTLKASGQHLQYPFYRERIRVFDQTHAGEIDTWDYQKDFVSQNFLKKIILKLCPYTRH